MSKNVVILVLVAVIVGASGAYVFARQPEKRRAKIDGTVYVLPKEFLVNLHDGRYARLNVALVLDKDQPIGEDGHGGARPPEGFGELAQEAVVRDIVTDVLTDENGDDLISSSGRARIKATILERIKRTTDVRAEEVLITDVAVQ